MRTLFHLHLRVASNTHKTKMPNTKHKTQLYDRPLSARCCAIEVCLVVAAGIAPRNALTDQVEPREGYTQEYAPVVIYCLSESEERGEAANQTGRGDPLKLAARQLRMRGTTRLKAT